MVADASIGYSIQGERNEGKKRNQDKGKVQQQSADSEKELIQRR